MCATTKSLSEYHRSVKRYDGVQSRCKVCENTLRRRRYEANKGTELDRRDHNRLRGYGITVEIYNAMLEAQGGVCAICPATTPGGKGRWHVDHDHGCCPRGRSCGACVRGLLCAYCNTRLGMVENADWMRSAQAYLAMSA